MKNFDFNPFLKFTIRNRLIVGFGFIIVLLIAAGSYTSLEMAKIKNSQENISSSIASLERSETAETRILQAELLSLSWVQPVLKEKAALMSYVVSEDEDEQQALFAEFSRLGKEIVSVGDQLSNMVTDEELRQRVKEIQDVQVEIRTAAVNVIAAFDGEGEYGEETRVEMQTFSMKLDKLIRSIESFQEGVTGIVANVNADILKSIGDVRVRVNESVSLSDMASTISMLFVVVSLVLALVMSMLIYRSITEPLNGAIGLAQRIAKYDLSSHGSVRGNINEQKDEISVLMVGLYEMRNELRDLVSTIQKMGDSLTGSARELTDTSEKITVVTNEQLQISGESVNIATNLQSSSDSIAGFATGAADYAREADSLVKKCVETEVGHTNSAMLEVRNEMNNTRDRIHGLSESAEEIGDIIVAITGIAEQTNLLALNAAIEAARAGEQGRGFAVVADEVRTLAERTAQSTSTIAQVISKVQSQVKDAVISMEASEESVKAGSDAVSDIAKSLEAIENTNHQLTQDNQQIADGTNEQKASADSISANLELAKNTTSNLYEHAQNINGQASTLNDIVNNMNNAVARFKV